MTSRQIPKNSKPIQIIQQPQQQRAKAVAKNDAAQKSNLVISYTNAKNASLKLRSSIRLVAISNYIRSRLMRVRIVSQNLGKIKD